MRMLLLVGMVLGSIAICRADTTAGTAPVPNPSTTPGTTPGKLIPGVKPGVLRAGDLPCKTSCASVGIPSNCAQPQAAKDALAKIGVPACNHPELCAKYTSLETAAVKKACAKLGGATGNLKN